MSVLNPSSHADSDTYECDQCGDDRTPETSVKGSFCSRACWLRHKREKQARDILNQLQHDHRFCFTCFRQLKEVEPPKPDFEFVARGHRWARDGGEVELTYFDQEESRKAAVGFEFRTEHTDTGEKTLVDRPYGGGIVGTGVTCPCGNCEHRHAETTFRDRHPFEHTHFLVEAIRTLDAEEKLADGLQLSVDELFESVVDHNDLETALADAIRLVD